MSREFPDFVDPWRAADGSRHIGGSIPLARMRRLRPLLASDRGDAHFSLQFGYDAQRRATVEVEVRAPLELLCQRSLEPYIEQVAQFSVLQVIGAVAEQALLSGEEEFVLVEDGRVAVLELVEDELLLAVPQVPRNPALDPVSVSTAGDARHEHDKEHELSSDAQKGGKQRPFESLAELMKNK